MSPLDPAATPDLSRSRFHFASAAGRFAPALFAATLFASALLLFSIQPMFTKMVLPRLGGAPAVWSVAMVFFQGALLAGYAYAHVLVRRFDPARAALIHLGLLALAAASLPIGIAEFGATPVSYVGPWLIALFACSIGLPFAALSASAPLLQAWFAATNHGAARNPYVLYAASNLGSFAGLIAYPFLIEPMLPLRAQTFAWSLGFAGFAVMVAVVAVVAAGAIRAGGTAVQPGLDSDAPGRSKAPAPNLPERLTWLALAAIPSGLTVAVTAHLATDVAAAPFLWVVPLALYLLTFVAIFRHRPWVRHETVAAAAAFMAAPLAISILGGSKTFWVVGIVLNLAGFMVLAMLCHGALYARRPAPVHLTAFYLWNSAGGVLGGAFAALAAPKLFNGTYEYPILICAALLAAPGVFTTLRQFIGEAAAPLAVAALAVLLRLGTDLRLSLAAEIPFQLALVAIAVVMLLQRRRPVRVFALAVLAFAVTGLWRPGVGRVETARSFFGVHEVADSGDGTHRILFHGTTIHGVEAVRSRDGTALAGRPQPESYYYAGGPYAQAIEAVRAAPAAAGRLGHVAIVGLGAGIIACHRREGETWTFFEIDPEVVRIARDERLFRSLSVCAPNAPIVLGDARLSLAASGESYDLIALDAFTSDAIPVHLLTGEAIASYLERLKPHGVILAHISNRHMDLAPVVAATAAAQGLVMWFCRDPRQNDFVNDYRANAELAALARSADDLGDLPSRDCWRRVRPNPKIAGWTDDYSDILRAILRRKSGQDALPALYASAARQ
jgi:hypothetical protein